MPIVVNSNMDTKAKSVEGKAGHCSQRERRNYRRYHFMAPVYGTAYIQAKGSFPCQLLDVGFGGARLSLRQYQGHQKLDGSEQVSIIVTARENEGLHRSRNGQLISVAHALELGATPWEMVILSRHIMVHDDHMEIGGPYVRAASFSIQQIEKLQTFGLVLPDEAFDPFRDLREH